MNDNYFLRKVKPEEIVDVFELSNEDEVRRYSVNKDKIAWADHKAWFEKMLGNDNYLFYVVTNETDKFFGQVRYSIDREVATISISLGKAVKGRGLGRKIVKESLDLLRKDKKEVKTVIAFISEDNIASRKLFENIGFGLQGRENGMGKYEYRL